MVDQRSAQSASLLRHKRQLVWQILVPFFGMMALIIAAAIWIVVGGASQARLWADVSIIWLIAPALLFTLIGFAILVGLIYAVSRLTRALPRFTNRIQGIIKQVANTAMVALDATTKPVLWFRQAGAVLRSVFGKK